MKAVLLEAHGGPEALRATFVERWGRNDPSAYLRALSALVVFADGLRWYSAR